MGKKDKQKGPVAAAEAKKKTKAKEKQPGAEEPFRLLRLRIDTSTPDTIHSGLRQAARKLWPEYRALPDSAFVFKQFTDGLSNILFRVTIDARHKVLVRVYGVGTDALLDRDEEIRRQLQLSQVGLAAEFYAKFDNGCCYEYLEGTPLTPEQMGTHADAIATEVAHWHRCVITDESPPDVAGSLLLCDKWLGMLHSRCAVWKRSPYSQAGLQLELASLRTRLIASPMRFCHNDVLAPNVLLGAAGDVRFIDYEYASYNARGYDIGNHFCEYGGFTLDYERYPTRDQQQRFIEAYLRAFYGHDGALDPDEIDHVWREANQWGLVSHFLWGVWGLFQAENSTIAFDFMWYSNRRLAVYFRNREKFLTTTDYTITSPEPTTATPVK